MNDTKFAHFLRNGEIAEMMFNIKISIKIVYLVVIMMMKLCKQMQETVNKLGKGAGILFYYDRAAIVIFIPIA